MATSLLFIFSLIILSLTDEAGAVDLSGGLHNTQQRNHKIGYFPNVLWENVECRESIDKKINSSDQFNQSIPLLYFTSGQSIRLAHTADLAVKSPFRGHTIPLRD